MLFAGSARYARPGLCRPWTRSDSNGHPLPPGGFPSQAMVRGSRAMPLAHTCDLFVIAGETSGDAYAAEVVRRLRARYSDLTCAAMGGPALREAGAEIEQDIEGLSVMGLGPVLARLPSFIQLGLRMAQVIRSRRPKVVL